MMMLMINTMLRPIIIVIEQDQDSNQDSNQDPNHKKYEKLYYRAFIPTKYTPHHTYYDKDEDGNNNYEFMKDPQGFAFWHQIRNGLGEPLHMEYYGHYEFDETEKDIWIVMGPRYNDILEICLTEDDVQSFIETPYRQQRDIYRIRYEEI
jgi:hypothetical protein